MFVYVVVWVHFWSARYVFIYSICLHIFSNVVLNVTKVYISILYFYIFCFIYIPVLVIYSIITSVFAKATNYLRFIWVLNLRPRLKSVLTSFRQLLK